MKASKFNEEQITLALHMAVQTSVDEVIRKLGIAQATFYRWKSKYGGLLPAEVKRLKQLEDEDRRLKTLLVDAHLDLAILKDVSHQKNGGARCKARSRCYVKTTYEINERWACKILNVDRSSIRYRPRGESDGKVRDVLRRLSYERHRFGYRRLHEVLLRDGIKINHKKVYRLYKEEELQVKQRKGRKGTVNLTLMFR